MLNELLSEPFILLNSKVSPLLHLIKEPNILEIIKLLSKISVKSPNYSLESRLSYFEQHRAYGHALLDALKKNNTEHHLAHSEAYNLVKVMLYFYKEDMNLVEIDLEPDELKEINVQDVNIHQHHHKQCVIS
jgi:hypothetical protein